MEQHLDEVYDKLQVLGKELKEQRAIIEKIEAGQKHLEGLVKESIMASVFHDSIAHSHWFRSKRISPGRWAAGYSFLYPLYRVLDEFKPTSILELGLGQTTVLTSAYAKAYPQAHVDVVEHDPTWIDFFNMKHVLSKNVSLHNLQISFEGQYKEDSAVVVYEHFADTFKTGQFDLIIIDGPFGGYAKIFSRTDILSILPDCLKKSFVLFLDDSQRTPEKNTIKEIRNCLKKHDIKYLTGEYRGEKNTYIITSEDLKFFCSM